MLDTIEENSLINKHLTLHQDAQGRQTKLSIWHELNNDVWGAASTCPRIVNNIRICSLIAICYIPRLLIMRTTRAAPLLFAIMRCPTPNFCFKNWLVSNPARLAVSSDDAILKISRRQPVA